MIIGKFKSGLLALIVVWFCAAYAQAQDTPPASQGAPKVFQGQTKELGGTTAFSSTAPDLQATQGQTALPVDQKSEDDRILRDRPKSPRLRVVASPWTDGCLVFSAGGKGPNGAGWNLLQLHRL